MIDVFEQPSEGTFKVFENNAQVTNRTTLPATIENKSSEINSNEKLNEEDIKNGLLQACYGDLLEHSEKFKKADEISEILQLMAPYHVRRITRASTKNMCEFVGVITSAKHDEFPVLNDPLDSLDPLIYNHETKKILNASFDWLDNRINNFEGKLNRFSSKLRQWQNEIGDEPINTGIILGTILGSVAGPLGAAAGGFFGSLFSDDSAKDEFQRDFQFLLQDYADLIEEVHETLSSNLQLSINAIDNYIQKTERLRSCLEKH